jgi:putative transcriptional regulator
VDKEMDQFLKDLKQSVQEMKSGTAAKSTAVALSPIAEARLKSGLTQTQFAALMGVSPRTIQDWEQGRREPSGAAKTLLKVAVRHPEVLKELAA